MARMLIDEVKVNMTLEEFEKFLDGFGRKNFAQIGCVFVPIKQADGSIENQVFRVDPSKHTYDEYKVLLSAQYN